MLFVLSGCGASAASNTTSATGPETTVDIAVYCQAAERFFATPESDPIARKVAFEGMVDVSPPAIRSIAEEFLPLANDLAESRPLDDGADRARELLVQLDVYTDAQCPTG